MSQLSQAQQAVQKIKAEIMIARNAGDSDLESELMDKLRLLPRDVAVTAEGAYGQIG